MLVYTAIFDDYDKLKPAPDYPAEYVCVSDRAQNKAPWLTTIQKPYRSPRKSARAAKILSHEYFPESELTIYLSGAVRLLGNPDALAKKYLKHHNIAVFKHPHRASVQEEFNACLRMHKGNPEKIRSQRAHYHEQDFPFDKQLPACFVLFRRRSKEIEDFENFWWGELQEHSLRDQLSFTHSAWQSGTQVNYIPWREFSDSFHWHKEHEV